MTHNISSTEKNIKLHINFKYVSSAASLLSLEQDRYINLIKQALKNTLKGDFTDFISYKQLLSDLKEVAETFGDTSYMILNKLRDIQNIATIKGSIANKRLTLELDIPVLMKQRFTLHKITPLPIRYNNKIMLLSMSNEYFLVGNINKNYIPIKAETLGSCKSILDNSLLCFPQTEIYFENTDRCESNLLFNGTSRQIEKTCEYSTLRNSNFIKQISENLYYVSLNNNMPIRENCIKQSTTLTTINSTGLLRLNSNCEIIVNSMKLLPKNYIIKERFNEISLTNNLHKITVSNLTAIEQKLNKIRPSRTVFLDYNENFQKLINKSQIETQKLHSLGDINHLNYGTIALMGTWSWITLIILFIIVKILYKKCC